MAGHRAHKTVATEYREGNFHLTQMGDNLWSIYTGPNGSGTLIADGFRTLAQARKHAQKLD